MGMFDYIEIKMPLPTEPRPPDIQWFQTKDTEEISGQCYLERWTIEADGRLVHHSQDYETVTDSASVFGFFLRPANKRDEEHAFHGDIHFYHYNTMTREDWEYTARFTDGRCVRVWCSDHGFVPVPNDVSSPSTVTERT